MKFHSAAPSQMPLRRPRSDAGSPLPTATAAARERAAPTPGGLARRRILINFTKWLLPLGAAGLLATIALWPEFDHAKDKTRFSLSNVSGEIDGARLKDARYHGVDEKGRPYTITASTAHQLDSDRVELANPKGDLTQENGIWLMLRANHGLFRQRANHLDLWQEVTLYRDDGTTLTTTSAAVDIKDGSATGDEPVHVEGPFGVLDAQGFTLVDKGGSIQFTGPSRVVLNGASP